MTGAAAGARRRGRLTGPLQILPALVWLVVFFLLPMGLIALYSVSQRTAGGGIAFSLTFENFARFLHSPVYLKVTWRSLLLACEVTLVTLVLAYPVSYYLALVSTRWKPFLLILLVVPWWTSVLVKNFAWVAILSDHGLLNQLLRGSGLIPAPLPLLYTEFSVIVGLVHLLVPFMALPIFVTIDRLDPRLLEAAQNLGGSPFRSFIEVTLPLSMPGVATGCIVTFILTFGSFITPVLLGSVRNRMIANVIEDQFLQAFHWPLGAAISIVLLVLILALLLIFNRLVGLDRIWSQAR